VEGAKIRSRLLTARECARLMGLAESYLLPANENVAYHLVGDGVVVPVVRYLANTLLQPMLRARFETSRDNLKLTRVSGS